MCGSYRLTPIRPFVGQHRGIGGDLFRGKGRPYANMWNPCRSYHNDRCDGTCHPRLCSMTSLGKQT